MYRGTSPYGSAALDIRQSLKGKWEMIDGISASEAATAEYLKILSETLEGAKKFILVYDGGFPPSIWSNDGIISALEGSKAKYKWMGGSSDVDKERQTLKNLSEIECIRAFTLFPTYNREHFIATDKSVLVEGAHGEDGLPLRAMLCEKSYIINKKFALDFACRIDKESAEILERILYPNLARARTIMRRFGI